MKLARPRFVRSAIIAVALSFSIALRAGPPSDQPTMIDSMDAAALAKIAPRMHEFVDDKQIAGAVTLVMLHGQIVDFQAVGLADIAEKRPMTRDSLVASAS